MAPRRSRIILAIAAVALVALAAWLLLAPRVDEQPEAVEVYEGAAPTPVGILPWLGGGVASRVDLDWLADVSEQTGIPPRALTAYAAVAIAKAEAMPTCGVSWNTLAAIGSVESDHGTHGGSTIADDGTVSPGIFGIALEGGDTDHIPDSDNGEIDGDTEFDRAVGPMQMIPQTWRNWHIDANGDGVDDPQNMDDAVFAAANYLCRASPDMVSVEGWTAGIRAYNSNPDYLQRVIEASNRYRVGPAD